MPHEKNTNKDSTFFLLFAEMIFYYKMTIILKIFKVSSSSFNNIDYILTNRNGFISRLNYCLYNYKDSNPFHIQLVLRTVTIPAIGVKREIMKSAA